MSNKVFIAKNDFATQLGDAPTVVNKGARVPEGHELLDICPDNFEEANSSVDFELDTGMSAAEKKKAEKAAAKAAKKAEKDAKVPEQPDQEVSEGNDGNTPEDDTEAPIPDVDKLDGNDSATSPVPEVEPNDDLKGKTRGELNEIAAGLDIADPDKLANIGEVTDAIAEARKTQQ